MNQPWLTTSDWHVKALNSNEAKKSAASATSWAVDYVGLRGQVLANLLLQVICKLLVGRHSECVVTALDYSPDNFRAHGQLIAADPCPGLQHH
jgi:hypothetical protein